MKILRASAGSGKTYQLSHTYLDRLLESGDPNAYRHILAVTFTNKATAEMKTRILRDLAGEAESDGRARRVLRELLHDYSAFSISSVKRSISSDGGHIAAMASVASRMACATAMSSWLSRWTMCASAAAGM